MRGRSWTQWEREEQAGALRIDAATAANLKELGYGG